MFIFCKPIRKTYSLLLLVWGTSNCNSGTFSVWLHKNSCVMRYPNMLQFTRCHVHNVRLLGKNLPLYCHYRNNGKKNDLIKILTIQTPMYKQTKQ